MRGKPVPKHPLAEVFGFPIDNDSLDAIRYRKKRLCPFNNNSPNCTKDKVTHPFGVCSVHDGQEIAIPCPVRFRQDWLIADDAAAFFFPPNATWTSLVEVRWKDKDGLPTDNIDVVLVSYDDRGRVTDFGGIEILAMYKSKDAGRKLSSSFRSTRTDSFEPGKQIYRVPDLFSASTELLLSLNSKLRALQTWNKKLAIVIDSVCFDRLPRLKEEEVSKADIIWLVYTLQRNESAETYNLTHAKSVYMSSTVIGEILTGY